jgi:hypothetical protein
LNRHEGPNVTSTWNLNTSSLAALGMLVTGSIPLRRLLSLPAV